MMVFNSLNRRVLFFFFNDTATTEIYTLSLHDALPISTVRGYRGDGSGRVQVHPTLVRRVAEDRAALDRLREQAQAGVLTLRVARTMPAEEAAEAHRLLARGGIRGRLVLTF